MCVLMKIESCPNIIFFQIINMFSFQEMINFDNLAKSGGAGSSVSTEMSVATVGVSSS